MDNIVDLSSYRKETEEKREQEKIQFPGIIAGLRPMSLLWFKHELTIEYDATGCDIHTRIEKNPAWGVELFGVVSGLRAMVVKATVVAPDRVTAVEQSTAPVGEPLLVIRVKYRTREDCRFETKIGERSLHGTLQHIFSPPK